MNYDLLAIEVDNEIALLSKDYSRQERKWLLATDEEVLAVQTKIRTLRHKKQIAWEAMIYETKKAPLKILEMLEPIIQRRKFRQAGNQSLAAPINRQVINEDGTRFTFNTEDVDYKPKHIKGFWSCSACMLDSEKELPVDFGLYKRQIEWCPKFVRSLRMYDLDHYAEVLQKIDVPVCYAGLFHAELQVTQTEAKLVKLCDTCGYTTTEIKELAQPTDSFEVGVNNQTTRVSCNCKICGALIFDAEVNEARQYTAKYEAMLDDHYNEKHNL